MYYFEMSVYEKTLLSDKKTDTVNMVQANYFGSVSYCV